MVKRPVVIACIGYIIGILWGLYLKISIIPFCLCLDIFLAGVYLINEKIKKYGKLLVNKAIIIFEICAIVGSFVIIYNENKYSDFYEENKHVKIYAVVLSEPQISDYYIKYKIKITDGKYKDRLLLLNVKQNKIDKFLEYGSKIVINGKYKKPEIQRNTYGFDYQKYLKSKGIQGSIICSDTNIKIIDAKYTNSFLCIIYKVKVTIKDRLKNWLDIDNAGLIIGMLLGDKNEIDKQIVSNFKLSNLSHLLAVSGTHISYIILILSFAVKKTGITKRIGYLLIIAVLFSFSILVGDTPSVVRATIMVSLIFFSKIIYEKADIFTNLAVSSLIILIKNPYSVWDIGFQLSYLATIGIILFYSIIFDFLNTKINNLKILNEIIALSISAQLFILPVLIYNFHVLPLNFILSNIFATPLFAISIVLAIVMISFGSIWNPMGEIVGFILNKILTCFNYITNVISNIPFSNITVIRPNFTNIVIYYIVLISSYELAKIIKRRETWEQLTNIERKQLRFAKYLQKNKMILIKALIVLVLTLAVFKIIGNLTPQNLKINFIDVGQGDACLIQTRQHKSILIDGGGSLNEEYNVGEKVLMPYILNKQVSYIDYMIISHFDEDHVRTDYYI